MTTFLRSLWENLTGANRPPAAETPQPARPRATPASTLLLDMPPHDPLVAYFQSSTGAVEIERLNFASPLLDKLRAEGAKMVVPLVAQGELIGLLNLGPRRSEQEYSADDRGLLTNLAGQAAPAVRVAQLVRQQQIEAQARERLEQELRVARLIQQTLLPRELPELAGWKVAAYYQPARAVGGDFYDFIQLSDGRLAVIVGDVTDKGVPAALLMATTRAHLRAATDRFERPGQVLAHVNDVLAPDIPRNMFVTCLYAILDPATGQIVFANAGHDLPYRRALTSAAEIRATGMPLGLLPGMTYEERETTLNPGESLLLYSDGLVEAHNPRGEMFGFPRLGQLIAAHAGGAGLIDYLLEQLRTFTGPDWEQEDDTTLVLLQRYAVEPAAVLPADRTLKTDAWPLVAQFSLASERGNEREALTRVAEAVSGFALPPARLERLKTAVAEATMNAMEHGNRYQADLKTEIVVRVSPTAEAVAVHITDHGGGQPVPEPTTPNLEAKLLGQQPPRGWGLFLIEKMVDEMNTASDARHHTVELIMRLTGDSNGNPTA
jgi:serine phosphatase RsbU (regulator of sigma subunit)/anti-sigma regulatory factor (Ser/Thr protein kinase)